jgi:PQQ-dependent catabolism-associated beta-propeller protein
LDRPIRRNAAGVAADESTRSFCEVGLHMLNLVCAGTLCGSFVNFVRRVLSLGIAFPTFLSGPTSAAFAQGRPLIAVSNEAGHTVTLIDAKSLKVLRTVSVPQRPRGIEFSPDGRQLFVALSDPQKNVQTSGDGIVSIELASGRTNGMFPAGSDPERFAITPDGKRLYAANEDGSWASATDIATRKIVATLIVGIEPEGVAVTPDGRWAYVTAETSNSVSVIDTRANKVVANFLVDVRPRAVAFSPDGKHAYVTAEIGGTLSVIDTRTRSVTHVIPLERRQGKPVGLAVSPDGKWVYVANGNANVVSVVDVARNMVVGRIPVGRRPWGIAVSRDGRTIYTADGLSDAMSVIDAASRKVVGTVKVGRQPWGVAVSPSQLF